MSDEHSRLFETVRGAQRPHVNSCTAAVDPKVFAYFRLSNRDAFAAAWPSLRERSAALGRPGLVMAAMDVRGVAAVGAVAATDSLATAVIGRHSEADLHLPDDPTLSLRHLVVLLDPVGEYGDTRYRVLDLDSGRAFADEEGEDLDGIETDGPAFLTSASYRVIIFPTRGDGFADLPEDASAWEAIPPRVYHPLRVAEAPAPGPRVIREGSRVLRLAGPVYEGRVDTDPDLAGALVIGDALFGVDVPSIQRGILLGRYPRCFGVEVFGRDGLVSRVHALLIAFRGKPWVIDLASTNGVYVLGEPVRQAPITPGARVFVGETSFGWIPGKRKRESFDIPE
ncbi:MAG: FHA domain-containing protein [Deltaproteobacteria bacterium]|nr:MAG: FHA domain-containing protein [Deltaproteobacteria bacterium]